jgi:SAM-dependent methyltransferase
MHATAYAHMTMCLNAYLSKDRHYRVLDLGSRKVGGQLPSHREMLENEGFDHEYVGIDIRRGPNVDVVMKKPYRFPFRSNSFDVVMSNQTFEHIAFPWVSFLEMCRVVRPGGLIFIVSPSRGRRHGHEDCWRYYPDSWRALAAIARMHLVESFVDLPPRQPNGHPDYSALGSNWWGDSVGVFRKPMKYSKLVRVYREVNVWWANRVGGLAHIPNPPARPGRRQIGPEYSVQQQ